MFFLVSQMSFRSNSFYIASAIACFVFALTIKLTRSSYSGESEFFLTLLGSLPSFLYLFGLISLVPIVKKDITYPVFIKTAFFITLGALAYEFEQAFTSRVFDYYDVLATTLALLLMMRVHHIEKPQI